MISCILLSAGESKRLGSPKALVKLNGESVIEHIQKTLLSSKIKEIIIVLGADKDKIKPFILKNKKTNPFDKPRLESLGLLRVDTESGVSCPHPEGRNLDAAERIKFVINQNFKEGQTSSFKEGLKAVSPDIKGIMLLPVDLPLIKKETLDNLIDYFLQKTPLILIPTYQGKHGHPPIFNISLKDEFLNLENSKPLFEIQHKYNERIVNFPVEDSGVVLSFNTAQELQEIKKNYQKNLYSS